MKLNRKMWVELTQAKVEEVLDWELENPESTPEQILGFILARIEYAEKSATQMLVLATAQAEGIELV
jgi:hypothetical protein